MQREILKEILSGDVVKNITGNLRHLTAIIPEICDMIGFEHRHPHHHLDVWEHTLFALSMSPDDFDIRLALLLHDIGKPHSYQDEEVRHFRGHPRVSAEIGKRVLERLGYEADYIYRICRIISRHDTPLTADDILTDAALSAIIFEVQKCDALAHDPTKNKKRTEYIEATAKLLSEYGQGR